MEVRRGKLKVADNEMRLHVRGAREPGAHVAVVAHGPAFPQVDFDFVVQQLTEKRLTWLSVQTKTEPEPPFLDAWAERDFDPNTIRFSIRHLLGEKQRYPKARLQRQRAGVLYVCWAREEHDTVGDVCTNWRVPCSRRDSSFFHHWLSTPLPYDGHSSAYDSTLIKKLELRGFDITSLRFEIHHRGRRAALDQARRERQAEQAAATA